jgi:hypothetical protein
MKNLLLVTSIIDTPNHINLSYGIRSRFTREERFVQTKKTIENIKNHIHNSIIFIVECSPLNKEEEEYFISNCQYFLNLYNDESKRKLIYSESKAICEGTQTISAINFIIENNIIYDNLIKLSGRYFFTPNVFDLSLFLNNSIVAKYVDINQSNASTVIYKIPNNELVNFFLFLNSKINFLIENNEIGYYELIFGEYLEKTNCSKIILETIGVEGEIATYSMYYKG